jgi:Uma2 family endonuclease
MPAPVTDTHHANPHFNLIGWLAVYASTTSGVVGGDNGTLRLDLDNEPQPDAYLRILPECGGQALVDEDAYIRGAPELVAEVAGTSANYDLHAKLNAYRRNQVREYVVWRTRDEVLDWFILREGRYDRLQAAEDGIFRSEILPGLWLDPAALLCGDLLRVMDVVRLGVATSDHAKFIAKLASARQ